MKVKYALCWALIMSATAAKAAGYYKVDPVDYADVVARDLAYPVVSILGHTGLYSGGSVIEVLNSGQNVVYINSLASFKAASAYWGSAYFPNLDANPLVTICADIYCRNYTSATAKFAIIQRALRIQQLGADYTYGAESYPAIEQYQYGTEYRPPRRGKYRCDTFIKDVFSSAFWYNVYWRATEKHYGWEATSLSSPTQTGLYPQNYYGGWPSRDYMLYFHENIAEKATPLTIFEGFIERTPIKRVPSTPPRGSST